MSYFLKKAIETVATRQRLPAGTNIAVDACPSTSHNVMNQGHNVMNAINIQKNHFKLFVFHNIHDS